VIARPETLPARTISLPLRAAAIAAAVAGAAFLVVLRLRAMHPGLLYPDGYQYLVMARGIGQHLLPVATLGPGGDALAPSADAAAKPLFPALVSLAESLGLSPIDAARAVSAIAGAAVAPLAGLVAFRLGASRAGAVLAAALCLASPALGFWLGFPGPEALAEALALAAAFAFLSDRPVAGGVLAGLAVTSRPELLALALAAALAAAASSRLRHRAVLGSAAGLAAIAVVVGLLRPPLSTQTLVLLAGAAAMGCATAAAVVLAGRLSRPAGTAALAAAVGLLAAGAATVGAWRTLAGSDWALLVLAAAGLAAAAGQKELRTRSLRIAALTVPLALTYWWKNPESERYAAVLLPALAVLAGLGLGRLRAVVLAGAAGLALLCALQATMPSVGPDPFQRVASRLEHAPPGPLVTAAPDAYGALLPGRAVRVMRPGAAGLVLVDGPARLYEPDLRVAGRLVATLPAGPGFLRPDGRVDDDPVLLYRGTVVQAAAARR
jgi:hypothetical protein